MTQWIELCALPAITQFQDAWFAVQQANVLYASLTIFKWEEAVIIEMEAL